MTNILLHIVQYGVVRFPMGLEESNEVVSTTYALKDMAKKRLCQGER